MTFSRGTSASSHGESPHCNENGRDKKYEQIFIYSWDIVIFVKLEHTVEQAYLIRLFDAREKK